MEILKHYLMQFGNNTYHVEHGQWHDLGQMSEAQLMSLADDWNLTVIRAHIDPRRVAEIDPRRKRDRHIVHEPSKAGTSQWMQLVNR